MRVLLPLRKVPTSKQSSGSSQSGDEDDSVDQEAVDCGIQNDLESIELQASLSVSPIRPESKPSNSAHLATKEPERDFCKNTNVHEVKPATTVGKKGSWKTTGLINSPQDTSIRENRSDSQITRKRRLFPQVSDSNSARKRSSLDKKPPAVDFGMVSGSRRRALSSHSTDDNSRDSPVSLHDDFDENNPASARGDENGKDEALNFSLALKKRGLEIREQDGDGNCLFRAVSLQVYGDPSMHGMVRKQCLDFMDRDKEHFSQFVTGEPFDQYVSRKRQDGVHGNNPEIQAISELFNRPVEVFCPDNGPTPLNIFHAEYKTEDAPIRLSYHDGNHYNAVVDPLVPTAGLGLGLPGLQPGLADKMQVAKAVAESDAAADQMEFKRALKESEDDELQRAIKESKLSAEHMYSNEALALSDMDATYFELEQAALEESLRSSNVEESQKQRASSGRRRRGGRVPASGEPCSSAIGRQSASNPMQSSSVASLPNNGLTSNEARLPPAVASMASSGAPAAAAAAVAASVAKRGDSPPPTRQPEEYPQTVQELVMNGFELNKVLKAFDLIGDNFDVLLSFLMTNSS